MVEARWRAYLAHFMTSGIASVVTYMNDGGEAAGMVFGAKNAVDDAGSLELYWFQLPGAASLIVPLNTHLTS